MPAEVRQRYLGAVGAPVVAQLEAAGRVLQGGGANLGGGDAERLTQAVRAGEPRRGARGAAGPSAGGGEGGGGDHGR